MGAMKLLLTSAGISNRSIEGALTALLGKPITESTALYVPTAIYPLAVGPEMAYRNVVGTAGSPFCEVGWKWLGLLELTALPSIREERWLPQLQQIDALLVGGGDPLYLTHWMRQSGLAALLPSLRPEMVYVGLSAGSMVMGPTFGGSTYGGIKVAIDDDSGLGVVDFAIVPHLDYPAFPENSLANVEKRAAGMPVPLYAIDDQTAIQVVDGQVEVVSEGNWRRFAPR